MHERCLANMSLQDAGPLELIDAAAAAGFDSVNLWLTPPPALATIGRRPAIPPVVGNSALVRAIRERLDATGVRVFAASFGWLGPRFNPAELEPSLETLARLGGRRFVVVGWDDDRARLTAHLAATSAAAAAYGLTPQVEFMPYTAVPTLAEAVALIDAAGVHDARVLVDALHLQRSGGTPADVAALPPERIGSIQLCDGPLEAPARERLRDESVNGRHYPGEGAFPLQALLAALPPGGVVEVEAPVAADAGLERAERARRCAAALRRFLG